MSNKDKRVAEELYSTQLEVERQLCKESYYTFFENAWEEVLEPATPLVTNWHIEYLCYRMQEEMLRIKRGEPKKKDIIINVPPRSLKTSLITTYLQSWCWGPGDMPWIKFLTSSYDDGLSSEHAVNTRRLMRSPWYQSMWGDMFDFVGDQSLKTSYQNDKTGHRIATSVGGSATGRGGDCFVGGTKITTEVGDVDIAVFGCLSSFPKVLSYNHKERKAEWRDVQAWRRIESGKTVRVVFRSGREFECTADHGIYVKGKGYTPARDLERGDKTVSNMHGVRGRSFKGKSSLHRVLLANAKSRSLSEVPVLHEGILPSEVRLRQSDPERQEALLLQSGVLKGASRDEERKKVCPLSNPNAGKAPQQVLLVEVPKRCATPKEAGHMCVVRWRFRGAKFTTRVLPPEMCQRCPLIANDGIRELEIPTRPEQDKAVCGDEAADIGAGRPPLCGLRPQGGDDQGEIRRFFCGQAQPGGASYRPKPQEQYSQESGHSLPEVPHEAPQVEEDEVFLVRELHRENVPVYDLQVEGSHNFFANEILAHNCIICDDPHNPKQAHSDVMRKSAIDWWEKTMFSRLNDHKLGVRIIIMQRLHKNDLTGYEIAKHPERYEHICLPAEEANHISPPALRKKYVNGLLFPSRFDRKFLDEARENDVYEHASQYQQLPSPEGGGKFKKINWIFWQFPGDNRIPPTVKVDGKMHTCEVVDLPEEFDEIINSWDMSFKDTTGADPVAGHAWARKGANKYLLDRKHGKMDVTKTMESVKELRQDTGFVTAVLVEDKANGPAVITMLKNEIPGMIPVKADVSKEARATPMMRQHAAGNIIVPHPDIFPWIREVMKEFEDFPKAAHDDNCLVAGTKVATPRGNVSIELLRQGDLVLTPFGERKIVHVFRRKTSDSVCTFRNLAGTPNHPVFVENDGVWPFIDMDSLTSGMNISILSVREVLKWKYRRLLFSMGSHSVLWEGKGSIISVSAIPIKGGKIQKDCMLRFGNFITRREFQKAITFIISTATLSITTLRTFCVFRLSNTVRCLREYAQKGKEGILIRLGIRRKDGTALKRDSIGTGVMASRSQKNGQNSREFARCVEANSIAIVRPEGSALTIAEKKAGVQEFPFSEKRYQGHVGIVDALSRLQVKENERDAHALNPARLNSHGKTTEVYNIEVERDHVYYANGVLVGNCDAAAHAINFLSEDKHQVVGHYRWNDPRTRSNFDLHKDAQLSAYAVNYAAVVQQEDLGLCHVFCAWDPISNKLWIYDELFVEHAIPAIAAMQVQEMMRTSGIGIEKLLADEKMFGKKPQERTIVKQYKKYGLNPKKPHKYDKNGAIAMTIQLFSLGRVSIHSKCIETDRQLRDWVIERGKPKKKNVGQCLALCLVVSELERRFRVFAPTPKIPTYQRHAIQGIPPIGDRRRNSWLAT